MAQSKIDLIRGLGLGILEFLGESILGPSPCIDFPHTLELIFSLS